MSSPSPSNVDTEAAPLLAGEDDKSLHADNMSDVGSFGIETPQAKRVKAQALALSKAAQAARARYARLISADGDQVHSGATQTDGYNETLDNQASRIDGTESALAATVVADQLRNSFPNLRTNPFLDA